ncbi:S41 family peptidase [Mucilaginibacter terrae]|uniref:S41 family peptidase n=1 Tax=Mucilaginibacter terrae TaxID=1955052 RepID=UPI003643AFBC
MKKTLLSIAFLAVVISSCKKDKTSEIDELKDKVYEYAQEVYLWYDALPAANSFNPRQFSGSSDLNALQNEIDALSQIKINPSTDKPYEYDASFPGTAKYSYIDGGEAATSIGGTGTDFGFSLSYANASYNDLRIRYVYPNSSAATQNLLRGYRVLAVNDGSVTATTGSNSDPVIIRLNQALSSNSMKLNVQRFDGTTFTTTVTKGSYTTNPVIKYSTITSATGKKVGYFAFSRFTVLDNAKPKIDEAFSKFAADNVTELVIDLRYNGGGSVETAEYLANYMVPAAMNNTIMFTEYYNNKMQSGNHPVLSKDYNVKAGQFSLASNTYKFSKIGGLNLNQVFFIVTSRTASASELVINNLKPALPQGVKLIGQTTYGKPVGFFGIKIGDYDMYLAEFESRNAEGKADFYQGMIPGSNFAGYIASDDVTKDFGDPTENLLSRAISYIDKGTYIVTNVKGQNSISGTEEAKLRGVNQLLDNKHDFSGAVHDSNLKRIQ